MNFFASKVNNALMHGVTYPLLSVLLFYPVLDGQLGEILVSNVIVVDLKGSCWCSL